MSLYTVIFLGSTPIGGPLAGWVGEHISARFGFAAGGAIAVATGLVGARRAHEEPAHRSRGSRRSRWSPRRWWKRSPNEVRDGGHRGPPIPARRPR